MKKHLLFYALSILLPLISTPLVGSNERVHSATSSLTHVIIGYLNNKLGLGIEESQVAFCTLNRNVATIILVSGRSLQVVLPD